jgi:thiamine pyrophosphokinase
MKGIILLNGEPFKGEIDCNGAVVYCCDGAYDWAKGKVKIDKNIGDFDSILSTPFPPPEEVYPSEKDYTDGEIALQKMLKSGFKEIEIYGGGGGREDHFIGNLHLLYKAHMCGAKCKMITNYSTIFLFEGRERFSEVGKTLSLLPFGGTLHINDSAGFKYRYPQTLSYGECRGISNIVESEKAFLDVGGIALVIIQRG